MDEVGHPSKHLSGQNSIRRVASLAAFLVAGFLVFAVPVILTGNVTGRAGHDQFWFHEWVVRRFSADWPSVDLSNYRSATTPGYHLLLALVARTISSDLATLRLVASFFTIALYALFAWAITKAPSQREAGGRGLSNLPLPEGGDRGESATTLSTADHRCAPHFVTLLALSLPALASMYILFPGAWLQPDNAGWLFAFALLLLCARRRFDAWTLVGGGLLLLAAVWMRQIHIWCAGPLLAAAWLGSGSPGRGRITDLLSNLPARIGRTLLAALAIVPSVAFLGAFRDIWGGLTPPMFRDQYPSSINPATPAFHFALVAIVSGFFLGWLVRAWANLTPRGRLLVALAALAGLAAAAIPETTYFFETRSGGLWGVVNKAPVLFSRTSIVFLALSPIGAAALATFMLALNPRLRWLTFGAAVAFITAQTATPLAWQRYHEPLILLCLPLLALAVPPAPRTSIAEHRLAAAARLAGPFALALLLAAITALTLRSAHPVPEPSDPNAPSAIQAGCTPHRGAHLP